MLRCYGRGVEQQVQQVGWGGVGGGGAPGKRCCYGSMHGTARHGMAAAEAEAEVVVRDAAKRHPLSPATSSPARPHLRLQGRLDLQDGLLQVHAVQALQSHLRVCWRRG